MVYTLGQIETAVRESWSEDTCDPVDLPWSAANPSSGQCGTTALVLHDLLGGDLLVAEVVQVPRVVARPDGPPRRCAAQYELLRRRVFARLGLR